MKFKFFFLLLIFAASRFSGLAQVPAPSTSTGSANNDMNWTLSKKFDESGNVISETKSFFDKSGGLLQSQNKVKYRKDATTVYTHVFASQPLRDALERQVASTLQAPIDNAEFIYVPNFLRNATSGAYDYKNFDRPNPDGSQDKTSNPDPVGGQSVQGTLGWYYSNNNTWEPYLPTTNYPYSRNTIYRDGTGNAKKAANNTEAFKMGSGHEKADFVMPVINELTQYLAIRTKYFSVAEAGAQPVMPLIKEAFQQVSRDENGKENISIQDKSGNVLMTAQAGSDLSVVNTVTLTPNGRYSVTGSSSMLVLGFTNPNTPIDVYIGTTLYYQGSANGLNLAGAGGQQVTVISDVPFQYQLCTNPQLGTGCTDPAFATGSGFPIYYFKILANGTSVSITGNYTLKDMDTEQSTTLIGGNSLNKGYYKLIANTGNVTLTYGNAFRDISYSFYNQLGQAIATIAPEGVKKLHGTGINNYATKNDVPFMTLFEYDVQGRLVKTKTAEGSSYMLYRKDGKIRFSQNEEQNNTGRFSYTNYDNLGRAIESGEYLPGAGGIAFNSDMSAVTNPMRDILENITSTGGLTNGTKTDVVITLYDELDNSHGQSGFVQDPAYLGGVVSMTRKYSQVLNNTPNINDMVSANWFSYNEEGKITWGIRFIKGLGYKTTEFTYDAMGRVTKRIFQKNTSAETFVHYYDYDPATQQLWKVYTNTVDNIGTRKLHATYIYYLHGPLKRMELGSNLQGVDYTYTVNGSLKAINNSNKNQDPGSDGPGNGFGTDAYGMVLDYYTDDYVNSRGGIQSIKAVNTAAIATDSYIGNIKAMTWHSRKPISTPGMPGVEDPVTYIYQYDVNDQFTESTWGSNINFGNTPASFTTTTNNKETIKHPVTGVPGYDANGNILYLQRTNSAGALTDKFTYNYVTNSNKLQNVVNDVTGTPQTYASYSYDEIGQLTLENTGVGATMKYIKYDVNGKVIMVARDAAFTQKVVEYVYDESGMRILKKSYNPSYQHTQNTYYVDDVVYIQPVTGGIPGTITVEEYELDGGGNRLGVFYRQTTTYAYELHDHLGSVRTVIAQNVSTYEVRMFSDYYPYGMVIQRNGVYRYEYQGKFAEIDGETNWNAFELRMYDSRIARWLSTDDYGQHWSPYKSMGNDPANRIDPDGGFDWFARQNSDKSISLVNVEGVHDPARLNGSFVNVGEDGISAEQAMKNAVGYFADAAPARTYFGNFHHPRGTMIDLFGLTEASVYANRDQFRDKDKGTPWMDIAMEEYRKNINEANNCNYIRTVYHGSATYNAKGCGNNDPWCSSFINYTIVKAFLKPTCSPAALSWSGWGLDAGGPVYGAIAVKRRIVEVMENGKKKKKIMGHVGYVVGRYDDGQLAILGGNQGDALTIQAYPENTFFTYRYPRGYAASTWLPRLHGNVHKKAKKEN